MRHKENNFELKLKLLEIDSIPHLVNRDYFNYYSFVNEKELIIAVNEKIYNCVMANDTILKEKNSSNLIKRNRAKTSFIWLSSGTAFLEK
jgi:hypothetical protein